MGLRSCFASSLSEFLCLIYYLSLGHGQSFTWLSGVSKERHNFRLLKIYRWATSDRRQCVQPRSGNYRGGWRYLVTSSNIARKKTQSFLVMASPKGQVEKRLRAGKRRKTLCVSPYFMPFQIWPPLVNFLFANSLGRNMLSCLATGGDTVYQKRNPIASPTGWPKPTEVS